jgi:sphingomyelin phosphodiesterase acid-like 3
MSTLDATTWACDMIFKKLLALYILFFASTMANAAAEKFITVADLHFDPFTSCSTMTPCPIIVALENTPSSQWKAILKVLDTKAPQYQQDTNFTLLETALAGFKKINAEQHAQFVIVLGDMLGHKFQDKYKKYSLNKTDPGYAEFVKKTLEFLNAELAATFPTTAVYMVVGNNDSYAGDYVSDPLGAFFSDTAKQWSGLIQDKDLARQMSLAFSNAGYYAVTPQSGLRLIVLNSNLFSAKAIAPETAGDDEFNWFEQQLATAHDNHERTLLIMHIPAGIDVFASLAHQPVTLTEFWRDAYTERFKRDLMTYADDFMGVLTAHIHSDALQLIAVGQNKKIFFSSTASISPVNGNNPGFKIFSYNTDSRVLENFVNYYLPLATLSWQQEYDFNAVYQPDCQSCALNAMQALPVQGIMAQNYQNYYDTESNSDPIHTNWHPYYWCSISNITFSDYSACVTSLK